MKLTSTPLYKQRFDRIEVSNIADEGYLGLEPTLSILRPLLKSQGENIHAALITLFMNAVFYAEKDLGNGYQQSVLPFRMKQALKYMPSASRPEPGSPWFMKYMSAQELFRDRNELFEHWMGIAGFEAVAQRTRMKMRNKNMVIPKWPHGPIKSKQDFDLMIASNSSGVDRYVEWVRED